MGYLQDDGVYIMEFYTCQTYKKNVMNDYVMFIEKKCE